MKVKGSQSERIRTALELLEVFGGGARIRKRLVDDIEHIDLTERLDALPSGRRALLETQAMELREREIDVVLIGEGRYPSQLATTSKPPAMLFTWGNRNLLTDVSVGMCGSRNASDQGLEAARVCGEEVARRGFAVVSGYAKGVDTETHLAALRAGGTTIIVLAQGIAHFRQKRSFAETGLPPDRTLVVSQFPPNQSWTAGGAMTRNSVIAGLSKALVVIEAGEKGGTLNAGLTALKMGRPVLALQFASRETPPGNEILLGQGARPVANRRDLVRELESIDPPDPRATQLRLPT